MFQKGEYIVYGHQGICLVEDITHLGISGADKEKLYYVLVPLHIRGSHIYYPVDRKNVSARKVMSREEAEALVKEIPELPELAVIMDKLREDSYKKALYSGDGRQWMSMVKTLQLRRKDRQAHGKRIASVDERYLKLAEDVLYGELAFVLEMEREEVRNLIRKRVEETESVLEHA